MINQMCWLPISDSNQTKALYVRKHKDEPWQLYSSVLYSIPDYKIPGGSKGWATMQKLLKEGWILVDSPTDLD